MPEIRLYIDMENFIKHRNLPDDKKAKINKRAQTLIKKELAKVQNK